MEIKSFLRDVTYNLLINRNRNLTYKMISDDTGLKIPWIAAFANRKISSPSVNAIETLFNYLNNKTIEEILTKY